jgi:leader peptidase (prepilin peptidase)/N-methyltransferase
MIRAFAGILAFVFGCVVGSFLNVVRYRLPRHMGIAGGRSKCPRCKATIAWYDNIPLVSYSLLGGRCRACNWKIPPTYLVVEAATGLSFLLVWLVWMEVGWPHIVAYWVLASLLIASAGIDFDKGIIPDKITLPGVVIGLIFSVTLLGGDTAIGSLRDSALGILVGGGSLLAVGFLYKLIRKVEGMGGGDVKLMAMVGAFLGFKLALLTIFLGSLLGGIIGLFVVRRSSKGMQASVPFGVFLAPAAIASMLWGNALIAAYLSLLR